MRACRGAAGASWYSTAGAGLRAAAADAALLPQDEIAIRLCTHGDVERIVFEKREWDTALPSIIMPKWLAGATRKHLQNFGCDRRVT